MKQKIKPENKMPNWYNLPIFKVDFLCQNMEPIATPIWKAFRIYKFKHEESHEWEKNYENKRPTSNNR